MLVKGGDMENKVELACAVYGQATVFPVTIARDAKVSDLQKAVAGIVSTDHHVVPPRLVTLYMARKNGVWLKQDLIAKTLLRGAVTTDYEEMLSTWELMDEELLGETFEPGRREIHVLVELPPKPKASIQRPLRYTGRRTVVSCRKFLDAVARQLFVLYDFDYGYYCDGVPTMGDVFQAVESGVWTIRSRTSRESTVTALPDYFTTDEWKTLQDLDTRTNRRLYDGKLPTTSQGKPFIILPHDQFQSDDQVNRLRVIAEKGNVVAAASELVVIYDS